MISAAYRKLDVAKVLLGQYLEIDPNISFWNGGETGFEGVGVLIKEKLMDHVVSVERVYNQII